MKTLHLILKKKWFDMIQSGEKRAEYRDLSSYWASRLVDSGTDEFKQFDTITFTNGYAKDAPRFVIDLLGIDVGEGYKAWGAEPRNIYYILHLGAIL